MEYNIVYRNMLSGVYGVSFRVCLARDWPANLGDHAVSLTSPL